jgi:hypothetical protein
MRRIPLLFALAAATALTACGNSSKDDKTNAPKPKEPVSAYAATIQKAMTTPNCVGLNQVNIKGESGFVLPCPATDKNPQAKRAFANFKVTGSEAFGTGGVIDFTDGEAAKGGTYIVAVGVSGRWHIDAAPLLGHRTVGGKPDRAGFDGPIKPFLTAIRTNDCKAFFDWAITQSQDVKKACREELPLYKNVAAALKAQPDVKPSFLGGNADAAFYSLRTDKPKPTYRTLAVVKTQPPAPKPYLVLGTDVGPAPK